MEFFSFVPAWRLAVAGSSFTIRCARGHGVRAFGGVREALYAVSV